MKIPFDITFRPQIESGEYKVILDCNIEAEILAWDKPGEYPIVCMAKKEGAIPFRTNNNGKAYHFPEGANYSDLFIVTPEDELTPFEKELVEILKCLSGRPSEQTYEDYAKEQAAELLSLAIDARAKELSKGLKQSKLDKDSIPYHLIEFMCNLYTCQNWKEIEDTAELYVTRIKAEALKVLPRWRKDFEFMGVRDPEIVGPWLCYKKNRILITDLEILPGFKED